MHKRLLSERRQLCELFGDHFGLRTVRQYNKLRGLRETILPFGKRELSGLRLAVCDVHLERSLS